MELLQTSIPSASFTSHGAQQGLRTAAGRGLGALSQDPFQMFSKGTISPVPFLAPVTHRSHQAGLERALFHSRVYVAVWEWGPAQVGGHLASERAHFHVPACAVFQ